MTVIRTYKVWAITDPDKENWIDVVSDSITAAAETAAVVADANHEMAFGTTTLQVVVRNPDNPSESYTVDVLCSLAPYYAASGVPQPIKLT